jgi:hypothetical protein
MGHLRFSQRFAKDSSFLVCYAVPVGRIIPDASKDRRGIAFKIKCFLTLKVRVPSSLPNDRKYSNQEEHGVESQTTQVIQYFHVIISYMKYVKGRLTWLVTFYVEIAFYNRLLKER